MTCKNIRGAKLWRQSDICSINKFSWVKEIPGIAIKMHMHECTMSCIKLTYIIMYIDLYIHVHVLTVTGDFHFLWEILRVIYSMFWGSPTQVGSLCFMREVIRRQQVDKDVKVFNTGDEFLLHVFKAHFKASIMPILNIQTSSDNIPHQPSQQWLRSVADKIVSDVLMPSTNTDPVYSFHRSFLHHMFMYIDLREAIRWENGPQIIRHWKWWLPRFLATGCRNYAAEAVNLIARYIRYIATHNRTVNTPGIAGRGKPVDQFIEHYNL